MHVRQSLLLAGFGKYLAVGNPELDSWIIEAPPLPHCLLDVVVPQMVLYMPCM